MSVFLQILHHSSVSLNITPLYFLRSSLKYFAQKEPIRVEILRMPSAQVKIHQILVIFETTNQFFLKFRINLQCLREIVYPFLTEILYTFNKRPLKAQIWWNFTWAVESLKFFTLMGSFCPNHIKFQLKKYRRVISHYTEEWCKV